MLRADGPPRSEHSLTTNRVTSLAVSAAQSISPPTTIEVTNNSATFS